MVSILIPAYNAYDYLFDCVDGIMAQSYFKENKNYEILIGVDGYHDTIDIARDLSDDYDNIRVILMKENYGAYITLNALLKEAKGDVLVRFDADDIMCGDMIEKGMSFIDNHDVVRFGNYSFTERTDRVLSTNLYPTDGVIMFKKGLISVIGGYKPWRTGADRDLMERLSCYKIKDITKPLYYKKVHLDSLFHNKDYGYNTPYRRDKRWAITNKPTRIEPEAGEYTEDRESGDISGTPVSIVISAYRSSEFIEECLDSIEGQEYFKENDNYEVLVGVDGCQKTLDRLIEIRGKYRNLRVFKNDKNYGVYTTINALMDKAGNENILRFDVDDVMKPHMIKRGMYYATRYDVVQFGYEEFTGSVENYESNKFRCGDGVIFLKRELFEKAGGFRPWSCAADSEFLSRVKHNSDVRKTKARLFYRRMHNDSLTSNMQTSYTSNKRRVYKDMIRVYRKGEDIKIDMVKAKQIEV